MSLTRTVTGYASRTRHKKKKRELAMALDPNDNNDQLLLLDSQEVTSQEVASISKGATTICENEDDADNSENMSDCVYKGERKNIRLTGRFHWARLLCFLATPSVGRADPLGALWCVPEVALPSVRLSVPNQSQLSERVLHMRESGPVSKGRLT